MFGEGLFEIDPALQVVRHEYAFVSRFSSKVVKVKVTARHKHKFRLKNCLVAQKEMHLHKCLSNFDCLVNLFLSDSCQLSAKDRKFGVFDWLDVGLELTFDLLLFNVDNDQSQFDDFLRLHGIYLVVAGAL